VQSITQYVLSLFLILITGIMKYHITLFLLFISLLACKKNQVDYNEFINSRLKFAAEQYKLMEASLPDSLMPRSFINNELITSGTKWWCSGFYPGTLWYLYEHTGDQELLNYAHERTMLVKDQKNNTGTHDLGFMLYCSFGSGLRLTGNKDYEEILLTGAQSLLTRYNKNVGCIKSWDSDNWQFPVIIDNMMNLEFLLWAADIKKDSLIFNKCLNHADKTMREHFRPDFSTYHVVDYDSITGNVLRKNTHQGFSDESAWARGQAWGLYGYVVMYRETGMKKYLDLAGNIADFLLNHPNLPEDKIPYWDFNVPDIPAAKRDASAAAIIASALVELSDYAEADKADYYIETAKKILLTLGSKSYMARKGENGNFIIKHSVGNMPKNSEVDVPLTYTDYYFVEGLMRLKKRL